MVMGAADLGGVPEGRYSMRQEIGAVQGVFDHGGCTKDVMDKHTTVFVVDDNAKLRESVVNLVRGKGLRAEEFSSVDAFLRQYDPTRKGVVVLDVEIDGGSAWELLRKLKGEKAFVPVVAAARNADIPLAVRAMREGAVWFLNKPIAEEELWQSISDAIKIEQRQHPQRKELADAEACLASLNEDERDVLRRLLAGHANKRIATDLDIGLRTVELRRAKILRKMKAGSMSDLVRVAILLDLLKPEE
jgi:two-component system, LuxR family, response regulator FixJ